MNFNTGVSLWCVYRALIYLSASDLKTLEFGWYHEFIRPLRLVRDDFYMKNLGATNHYAICELLYVKVFF
jgi:hypothetical protein